MLFRSVLEVVDKNMVFDNAPIVFGYDQNNQNSFNGVIHDLRIWNKVLTDPSLNNTLSGSEVALYGYWPIDEAFGTTVADKAKENHAVIKTSWFVDPIGKGVKLNGDEYVGIPLYALSENTDFTVEMWFKGDSQLSETVTLFGNGSGRSNSINAEREFNMSINSKGQLVYYSNNIEQKVSDDNVLDNQWHHIAVSANRSGSKIGRASCRERVSSPV